MTGLPVSCLEMVRCECSTIRPPGISAMRSRPGMRGLAPGRGFPSPGRGLHRRGRVGRYRPPPVVSSLRSQAWANLSSRPTVAGDRPVASAISS